jgi:hypothetical protein
MDTIKYVILLMPVNRYFLSFIGMAMKKTIIYTARTAYTKIVNK